jgi:hypothetical protein
MHVHMLVVFQIRPWYQDSKLPLTYLALCVTICLQLVPLLAQRFYLATTLESDLALSFALVLKYEEITGRHQHVEM